MVDLGKCCFYLYRFGTGSVVTWYIGGINTLAGFRTTAGFNVAEL